MYDHHEDALPAPRKGSASQPIGLLLMVRSRLHRQGLAALISQDDRFQLLTVGEGSPRRNHAPSPVGRCAAVAIVDAAYEQQAVRDTFAKHPVRGGVLLADLPSDGSDERPEKGPPLGPMRLAGVELSVVNPDSGWEPIARALAVAASEGTRHRRVGAPADERGHGPASSAVPGTTFLDDFDLYSRLTPREREVLKGLGDGLTPPAIASRLHIAVSTVENHKSRLMKKIDIHRTADLVRFAIRVGAAPL